MKVVFVMGLCARLVMARGGDLLLPVADLITSPELCETVCSCGYTVPLSISITPALPSNI